MQDEILPTIHISICHITNEDTEMQRAKLLRKEAGWEARWSGLQFPSADSYPSGKCAQCG